MMDKIERESMSSQTVSILTKREESILVNKKKKKRSVRKNVERGGFEHKKRSGDRGNDGRKHATDPSMTPKSGPYLLKKGQPLSIGQTMCAPFADDDQDILVQKERVLTVRRNDEQVKKNTNIDVSKVDSLEKVNLSGRVSSNSTGRTTDISTLDPNGNSQASFSFSDCSVKGKIPTEVLFNRTSSKKVNENNDKGNEVKKSSSFRKFFVRGKESTSCKNDSNGSDEKDNKEKDNSFRKVLTRRKETLAEYSRHPKVDSSMSEEKESYDSFIHKTCCYHDVQVDTEKNDSGLGNTVENFVSKDKKKSAPERLSIGARGVLAQFSNNNRNDGVSLVEVTNIADQKNNENIKCIKSPTDAVINSKSNMPSRLKTQDEDGIIEVYVGNPFSPTREIIKENNLTLILENNQVEKREKSFDDSQQPPSIEGKCTSTTEQSEADSMRTGEIESKNVIRNKLLKGLKARKSTKNIKENNCLVPTKKKTRRLIHVTRATERNAMLPMTSLIDAVHTKQAYFR